MPVTSFHRDKNHNVYGVLKAPERRTTTRLIPDKEGFVDLLLCGTFKGPEKLHIRGVIGTEGHCEITTPENISDPYFYVGQEELKEVDLILEPPVVVMTYGLLSSDWFLMGELIK